MIKTAERHSVFMSKEKNFSRFDKIVAVLPLIVWALLIFGVKSFFNIFLGVVCALLLETLICFAILKKKRADFCDSAVTGALVAMSLTVNTPVWICLIGCASAILLAKYQLVKFGKYCNIFSPVAFGASVSGLIVGRSSDFVEGFRNGIIPKDSMMNVLVGNTDGALGTVSAMLLIASGIYLICRGMLSPKIVLSAILSLGALSIFVVPEWTTYTNNVFYQMFAGGFLFYLIFGAGDKYGSPFSSSGKIVYGLLFGVLVFVFRMYTKLPVPEALAVLAVNLIAPIIDFIFKPAPFGGALKVKPNK